MEICKADIPIFSYNVFRKCEILMAKFIPNRLSIGKKSL